MKTLFLLSLLSFQVFCAPFPGVGPFPIPSTGGGKALVAGAGITLVTNSTTYQITSTASIVFTNGATLYVDPSGSDTTARRGVQSLPWKTLEYAVTNALVGDTVLLAAGNYYVSNYFRMPTNGAVVGAGRGATTVWNYYTNAGNLPYPIFELADNSTLANLSIRCGFMGQARYQAAYGVHQNLYGAYSNAQVINITADGETDTVFILHTNRTSTTLINPIIPTNAWDMIALQQGPHRLDIIDPYCVSTNVSAVLANQNHFLNVLNASNSVVNVYGGYIRVGNSLSRIVSSTDGKGIVVSFYGTSMTGSAATWFNLTGDGTLVDKLNLNGVAVDPSAVAIDLGNGVVNYARVVTTNIMFGGDADSGNGPTLTSDATGLTINSNLTTYGEVVYGNGSATNAFRVNVNGTTTSNAVGSSVTRDGSTTNTGNIQAATLNTTGAASVAGNLTITGTGNNSIKGNVIFGTDNTYDIGASLATRPKNYFGAGNGTFVGSLDINSGAGTVNAIVLRGSGTFGIAFNGRGGFHWPSDGVALLHNDASTDFTRLQLGGTTAAFPSIKRVNGNVEISDGPGTGTTNNLIVPGFTASTNGANFGSTYQTTINGSGLVTKYNGDTTAGVGLGTIVAAVDLTVQDGAANTGPITLYTPTAAGTYLMAATIICTTSGGSGSSTLTVGWTDELGATTKVSGAQSLTSTGRTTVTQLPFASSSGVAITYSMANTGTAGTKYSLHLVLIRCS